MCILSSTVSLLALNSSAETCGFAACCLMDGMSRATSERNGGGSCSQYSCSVPFSSLSWYKSSQYPFYLSSVCAASVKFSPVTDWIHCICDLTIRNRTVWNFLLSLLLPIPRTCLPAASFIHAELFLYLSLSS